MAFYDCFEQRRPYATKGIENNAFVVGGKISPQHVFHKRSRITGNPGYPAMNGQVPIIPKSGVEKSFLVLFGNEKRQLVHDPPVFLDTKIIQHNKKYCSNRYGKFNPPADPEQVKHLGEEYAALQRALEQRLVEWSELAELASE